MSDYKGIEYLRRQLANKRKRVELRYRYYEMKNGMVDFGMTTPPEMRALKETLGWCAKTVDSVADRLSFRGFRDDLLDLWPIFQMNNVDILADAAILSALISACCFIYISTDKDDYPQLQVIDGSRATGIPDPITGMLREGYAILEWDRLTHEPYLEAYFTPGETTFIDRSRRTTETVTNAAPYPLLVPIVYRPDETRPFGHSRISRACMNIMQGALRTIKRAEISGEFYSFPQKYVLGLSNDAEQMDSWKATMSSLLQFDKDEDGDHPVVGQFQQQSMTPYTDQMRMFAALFAGETGLTLDDLGFVTDNPSSAEAIKASHENLRLAARKAQKTFGSGFLNAGYLAACVRDDYAYERRAVYMTTPIWEPLFEPDMSTLTLIGNGALQINQAVPGFITRDVLRDLTGIEGGSGF